MEDKQTAHIAVKQNYANTGTCNVTSFLSLPDLNNIIADEEVDNADTDDSCALGTKQSTIPWVSRRCFVELGVLVLANALASCANYKPPLNATSKQNVRSS